MKKNIITLLSIFSILKSFGQESVPENLILYNWPQTTGTARSQALGGAMGALGNDGSAILINPAGSALMNYNHFSISGEFFTKTNENIALGNTLTNNINTLTIPNISAVFNHETGDETGVTKVNYGFIYETESRFRNINRINGTNTQSGIDYFLYHANNGYGGGAIPTNLVQTQGNETIGDLYDYLNTQNYGFSAQQAMLAYQAYLINNGTNQYVSNSLQNSFFQEHAVEQSGFQGKISANLGVEVNKKWNFGANFNFHLTNFSRISQFYEDGSNNVIGGVKSFEFNNSINSYGKGFSVQLGTIAEITDEFKIGLSYQSPIWHDLTDEFSQNVFTTYYNENNVLTNGGADPNLVTVYEPYRLRMPGNVSASAAYVIGKMGLISLDYTYKDYSKTKYHKDSGLTALNEFYKNEMQAAHDIRIGTEWRYARWSIRGGYRQMNSPYKSNPYLGDLKSYSGGLGYSFGTSRIDFAYTIMHQNQRENILTSGFDAVMDTKGKNQFINFTYSVNF